MSWSYVLANRNGRNLGELHATDRTWSPAVSKLATAGGKIRDSDPLWLTLESGLSNLKIYDPAGNLRFYGPVVSDEEQGQGEGAEVTFVAADVTYWLSKRFAGRKTALTDPDLIYAATDSGAIMLDVLSRANADADTGITAGTANSFVARDVTYSWKRASEALAELGAIDGSYEWTLRYVDGTPPTVYLDLLTSVGSDKPQCFFEYGTGRTNCRSYSRKRAIDTLATRIYALGGGSGLFASSTDAAAEAIYGRADEVVSAADISVASLLSVLASAHVAARSTPRSIVSMTPFGPLAPQYGTDWVVGDTCRARIAVANQARVDGTVRVWGANISFDDLGQANPELILVEQ